MGYSTTFLGSFTVTPALSREKVAYLVKFSQTRRIVRDEKIASRLPDETRIAVGLSIGVDGGYFAGVREDDINSENDPSVVSHRAGPPHGQPGPWCQWVPSHDGSEIVWDEGEKFYFYKEWLQYLIDHF